MYSLSGTQGSQPEGGRLGEVASAVRQVADNIRTIKILLIVYTASTIAIGVGTTLYAISGALASNIKERNQEARSQASEDGEESGAPGKGDSLPAISLSDADGRVWTNSDWEGKVVLLNFWATWCPPCLKEMPWFEEAQKTYGEQGFTVVAISVDRKGWDAVRPFLEEHQPSYPVLLADGSITSAFGRVNRLPTTYFVHRSGKIHVKHIGSLTRSHIMKDIEKVLEGDSSPKEPASAS